MVKNTFRSGDMLGKIGFIGAGNMAGAIIGGIVKARPEMAQNICANDVITDVLSGLQGKFGIFTTSSVTELVDNCNTIFLSVKPNKINEVINIIKNNVNGEKLIVSIAAGNTLEQLADAFNPGTRIIRVMPNTPALVGQAMTAICPGKFATDADVQIVQEIFNSIGQSQVLPESLMHAFIGVCGSSPAYAFMFIEALADAGVKHGLSRADSIKFSAQAVLGAARMVLDSPSHPAQLRDAVCSPGGTTICAVAELEAEGFRNAIIKATTACVEKSIEMSK